MGPSLRVLHLNTEKSWRGGENQIRLLIDGLRSKVEYQCGVAPGGSVAVLDRKWNCELFSLASSSPLDFRNIFKLVQVCKKQNIQIIDAHSAGAHSLALKALVFLPLVKLVVHRRVDNVPKSSFFTKRKYFSNRVQAYIAISKAIAGILKEYGISEEKLKIARSAYSLTEFSISKEEAQTQLRKTHSLDANTVLIGNASALSPQKGYETLIDAVKILKTRKLKFHVFIAGSGKLEEGLHQQVKALDLESH
ncbi:MAG: glycosyltransferase, partial [Pseudobdellovibrionaceae bacterium]